MKEVGTFYLNLPRGRGEKSIPAGSKLNLLRQICNFIPQSLRKTNAVTLFPTRYGLAVLSFYTTRVPFRSATVISACVPELNWRKSFSIPSLKMTPFSAV